MVASKVVNTGHSLISTVFRLNVLKHRTSLLVNRSPSCCCTFAESSRTLSSAVQNDNRERLKANFKRLNRNENLTTDFQPKPNHDPDVFGTLQSKNALQDEKFFDELPEEEGDVEVKILYKRRHLSLNQYGKIIKEFLNRKKVGNAIDVLETRMLKEDKVVPDTYIYNLLISGCARYGYTKKAFKLFNEMKKRGLVPSGSTYTSLFNACANDVCLSDGLKQINNLRETILEKGYELNQTNYQAMIKAYSRCNDIESAFSVVDEMLDKNIVLTSETFNFLLQACISDREAGFRHSLLVWRKMLIKGLKPDIYSFNMMLRCVRDCGLGNLETTKDVIDSILGMAPDSKKLLLSGRLGNNQTMQDANEQKMKNLEAGGREEVCNDYDNNVQEYINKQLQRNSEMVENCPDLLARYPHLGNMIGLTEIEKPEHRLILVGGCEGFLRQMHTNNVKPDIKTVSILLDIIPSTIAAEQALIKSIQVNKIEPDIDFFNLLIKKRSMRKDYKNAKEVLRLIQQHRLKPDIVTFGVLSLSCDNIKDADELRESMDDIGYSLNVEILGSFLKKACVLWDCEFVMHTMKLLEEEQVTPSPDFMQFLKKFNNSVNNFIKNKSNHRRGKEVDPKIEMYIKKVNDDEFLKSFETFKRYYRRWQKRVLVEVPQHPYDQFKKHNDPEDIELMNTGRKEQ